MLLFCKNEVYFLCTETWIIFITRLRMQQSLKHSAGYLSQPSSWAVLLTDCSDYGRVLTVPFMGLPLSQCGTSDPLMYGSVVVVCKGPSRKGCCGWQQLNIWAVFIHSKRHNDLVYVFWKGLVRTCICPPISITRASQGLFLALSFARCASCRRHLNYQGSGGVTCAMHRRKAHVTLAPGCCSPCCSTLHEAVVRSEGSCSTVYHGVRYHLPGLTVTGKNYVFIDLQD